MISKTNSPPIIPQPSPDVLKTQIEMLDARIKEKDAQINSLLSILAAGTKNNNK